MNDVVELDEHRPHRLGFVVCFSAGCGYAWLCVYPEDADEEAMHCPQCNESCGYVVDESSYSAAILSHRELNGITVHSSSCRCGQGRCREVDRATETGQV